MRSNVSLPNGNTIYTCTHLRNIALPDLPLLHQRAVLAGGRCGLGQDDNARAWDVCI